MHHKLINGFFKYFYLFTNLFCHVHIFFSTFKGLISLEETFKSNVLFLIFKRVCFSNIFNLSYIIFYKGKSLTLIY